VETPPFASRLPPSPPDPSVSRLLRPTLLLAPPPPRRRPPPSRRRLRHRRGPPSLPLPFPLPFLLFLSGQICTGAPALPPTSPSLASPPARTAARTHPLRFLHVRLHRSPPPSTLPTGCPPPPGRRRHRRRPRRPQPASSAGPAAAHGRPSKVAGLELPQPRKSRTLTPPASATTRSRRRPRRRPLRPPPAHPVAREDGKCRRAAAFSICYFLLCAQGGKKGALEISLHREGSRCSFSVSHQLCQKNLGFPHYASTAETIADK